MHLDTLTEPEQRVLGCLIEKRFTTPDQYPLTLNALRLACNQSTNRDPVVAYDEETVNAAAQRLTRYGLVRLASGHSSRATKYRHLAEEALGLGREEIALLAVLLLRGPQTLGELKSRSDRLVGFASLEALEAVCLMLFPIVPHICTVLWRSLAPGESLAARGWPAVDAAALVEDEMELVLQVNGKLRGSLRVSAQADRGAVEALALAHPGVQKFTAGLAVRKVIHVPGRLVNIVVG